MSGYSAPGVPFVPPGPSYLDVTPQAATEGTPRPEIAAVTAQDVGDALAAVWTAPGGAAVLLTRITVQCSDNAGRPAAYVYVGDRADQNLVSGTSSGHFDENDPNQPYFVPESTPVTIVWTTTTGTASARLEYLRA